ncbi:MAG: hypothetical protein ACRC9R_08780 [Enterovibrio sp.]
MLRGGQQIVLSIDRSHPDPWAANNSVLDKIELSAKCLTKGLQVENYGLVTYKTDSGERIKVLTEKQPDLTTTTAGISLQLDQQQFPCTSAQFKPIKGAQHKVEHVARTDMTTTVSTECPTVYDRPDYCFDLAEDHERCSVIMTTCSLAKNKTTGALKHTHTRIVFSYKPNK